MTYGSLSLQRLMITHDLRTVVTAHNNFSRVGDVLEHEVQQVSLLYLLNFPEVARFLHNSCQCSAYTLLELGNNVYTRYRWRGANDKLGRFASVNKYCGPSRKRLR